MKKLMLGLMATAVLATASYTSAQSENWYPYPVQVWEPAFDMSSPRSDKDYVPLEKASKAYELCVSFPHMKDAYWLRMGNDEAIMPFITEANVACGFHGSDPNHMRKTVKLAKQHGVKVGAHFSLPDLAGFGRREMKIEREEMVNIIIYQIGALKGFLETESVELAHLKPHGALYGMAARQEPIAHAMCDAAEIFQVPIFGLSGTLHEKICTERGLEFVSEFFADLDYDDSGALLITREHTHVDPREAGERALRAVRDGILISTGGRKVSVNPQTICIHSDTPNVLEIAQSIRTTLDEHLNAA